MMIAASPASPMASGPARCRSAFRAQLRKKGTAPRVFGQRAAVANAAGRGDLALSKLTCKAEAIGGRQ